MPTFDYAVSWVPLIPAIAERINPRGAVVDLGTRKSPWVAWFPLLRGDTRTFPVLFYRTPCQVLLPFKTIFYARMVWRDYGDVLNRCDWAPPDYRPWGTDCIPQDGAWIGSAEDYLLGVDMDLPGQRPAFSTHCDRRRVISFSRDGRVLSPVQME